MTQEMIGQPLLPSIGVVALVADPWDSSWRRRHHVLTRLARYFHVVWVNPAADWHDLFHIPTEHVSYNTDVTPPPGFTVCDPVWLPCLYRPKWLARHVFDTRLKLARRMLVSRGCQKIILYICRPGFAPALNSVTLDLSCYHIDDEYSFSPVEVPPDPVETSLIANVNQVFIHSPGLMEKKGAINAQTAFIPNGVDFAAYVKPVPEPKDLSVIPHPRILYTGYIKKQLDWSLIRELTRRRGEWSFVFVGPLSPHPEIMSVVQEISSYPNVHFLGAKSTSTLAGYPQHVDACILPYCVDAYTNNIYPLKLHEYLASGKPVVSVPIRSIRDFTKVVALASGVDEWSNALARTL